MGSQGYLEVHRREYSETSGAEMNRTHLVLYRSSTGTNFSRHAPEAFDGRSVGGKFDEMRPALEAHLAMMAEQGDPNPEPNTSRVEFHREDFEDLESFLVEPLAIQVPAYGRIHQAIPA
jgi:hypothetical protein